MGFFFKSKREKLEIERSVLERQVKYLDKTIDEMKAFKKQLEISIRTEKVSPLEEGGRTKPLEDTTEGIIKFSKERDMKKERIKQIDQQLSQLNKR